jgi:hypothetical protein
MYIVTLVYPGERYSEKIELRIEAKAGYSSGSGFGFGERDHSWDGLNKTQAAAKAKKLRSLRIPGSTVSTDLDAE